MMRTRKITRRDFYNDVVNAENPDNKDITYRVIIARMKLFLSEKSNDALVWLIRSLISTHPNPKPIFDDAPELYSEYEEEMKLIQIIFENALEVRNRQIEEGKDRK